MFSAIILVIRTALHTNPRIANHRACFAVSSFAMDSRGYSGWNGVEWRAGRRERRPKGSGKKKRRRTGCHKFKQQLTFRVKACGNGPLAMRICNAVSAERSAALFNTNKSVLALAKRIHAPRESRCE